MHQLIATLFALLVALCHHASTGARTAESARFQAQLDAIGITAGSADILPDRYQLAHGGYAEAACASCRRTSTTYVVR